MNDNRLTRYKGRAALRKITTVPACRSCGWSSCLPFGNVGVRQSADGISSYAGLATCGRIWLCPVCNAKVMARRALDIGAALTWSSDKELQVIWGSLTCQHDASSDLAQLLEIQQSAWRHVMNSKIWRQYNATAQITRPTEATQRNADRARLRKVLTDPNTTEDQREQARELLATLPRIVSDEPSYDVIDTGEKGRVGYIRAAEITIGSNGWHPHFHPVIFFRGTKREAQTFADQIVAKWVEGVKKAGGKAGIVGAQQLKAIPRDKAYYLLAGYATKATYDAAQFALEIAWSQGKSGRKRAKATTSHWNLLASIALGLADEAERWLDLEAATHGHRMITWSRGLRNFVGLMTEQTDEEIAAEELGTEEDTICFITGNGWQLVRDNPALMNVILTTLTESGWGALRELLNATGVEWVSPEALKDPTSPYYVPKVADRPTGR